MDEKRKKGESLRYSKTVSTAELYAAEEYLSSYRHGAKMLSCMKYGREFMGSDVLPEDPLLDISGEYEIGDCGIDETVIRARMYGVRQFISGLKCDSNSRLLLYWHYLRGVSVTRCAEMLDISRAGAFRVRKRALEAAARSLRDLKSPSQITDIMPL